ncbi:DUF6292 family protein [Actinophytocola sp.]|uniref:DUF6292 family protein n=1 Tax=Actinophytocola sp. TaxID=1872138 RepID=UPI002ED26E16
MTSTPRSHFVAARARAEQERTDQQRLAVRTVASNARDRTDFTALLSMLGLADPSQQPVPLSTRLAVYVSQVAAAIGVSAEATGYEVTDTATAYLGLDQRWATHPDHDLMLVWDERLGWYLAVETTPTETPVVLAYLEGDTVPPPAAVAQFLTDTPDGQYAKRIRPVRPTTARDALAERMAAVC